MLLSEFSFFVFASLVLSKVNGIVALLWENTNHIFTLTAEAVLQWSHNVMSYCTPSDVFSWFESRARICEAVILGSVVLFLVVFIDDYFGFSSSLSACGPGPEFQFGYRRRNGPAKWKEHYEHALGEMQSPINIVTCDTVAICTQPLVWSNHESVPEGMVMYNDGYSVAIQGIWKRSKPQITGEALDHVNYTFNRLYFHWGPTDTEGSEHTINYERYPLELHAIYLREGYATPMDAHYDNCRNGILIIAFLFEIAPVDNPAFLHTVTENLSKIRKPKSRCHIEPFPLTDIFPEFENSYFKYDGSITQPPCSEIVRYIVQSETIAVSRRQVAMFRKLIALDGKPMVNNSRPVQKLNSRTVYYCCPIKSPGRGPAETLSYSMQFAGGFAAKFELGLTWVSCSVVIVVTAIQILNNDIDGTEQSDTACIESCQSDVDKASSTDWKYGYGKDNGPHIWPLKSRTCGGKFQSPIDLDTTTSVVKHNPHLYWWNYNRKPRKMTLLNDGHSVMLKGEWGNPANIPSFWPSTGNNSEEEENYVFEQLHFHWGSSSAVGSEHTINAIQYPLEMHVVHRKRKFRDIFEAFAAGDGNVLVIAVLFKVSNHENEALTPITSALKNVTASGSKVEVKPFELRRLLPEFSNYFLMYNGSLTIPPCTEGVFWVIKSETFPVSLKQLRQFMLLKGDYNESLSNNYRPVQPLNGRRVWHIT